MTPLDDSIVPLMRAAVFVGPGPLLVRDVPRPRLEPGDLLVQPTACGICGTDVRITEGRKSRGVRTPSILGHEFAGRVVEARDPVAGDWSVGDGVAVQPVVSCGRCPDCLRQAENRCAHRQAAGYEWDGGLAEYVRIPAIAVQRGNVARLPGRLALQAAALAEPLAAVLNGQERSTVSVGDAVLVLGAGPIGLLHLQVARARGARLVIISEPAAARRAAALALGADIVLDPGAEDVAATARRATGGLGCDVVIVAVGAPQLVPDGLAALRRGGRINLFAGFDPGTSVALDPNRVHYDEVQITGASASSRLQFALALDLLASGRVVSEPLISHVLPLERVNEGLELVRSGAGLKVLIQPKEDVGGIPG